MGFYWVFFLFYIGCFWLVVFLINILNRYYGFIVKNIKINVRMNRILRIREKKEGNGIVGRGLIWVFSVIYFF